MGQKLMLIIWLHDGYGGEGVSLYKFSDPLQHIRERLLPSANLQLVVVVVSYTVGKFGALH